MADKKIDEDLDLGIEKGSKKKLIFIIIGAVLLLAIGGGAAWFFMSGGDEASAEETVKEETPPKEMQPPIYFDLKPKFVVNLPPGGKMKMLQLGLEVMSREQGTIDFIKNNDPMMRHNLLNLFSEQDSTSLTDRAGKEVLLAKILELLNKTIQENAGPGSLEAIYFSSFVMQ